MKSGKPGGTAHPATFLRAWGHAAYCGWLARTEGRAEHRWISKH
jgi:hypothetical protein